MRPALCIAILTTAALAVAQPQPLPPDRAGGGGAFGEAELRRWLDYLTAPECAGRGTGSAGFERAAEFMRDHFQALGLEPHGDDGSFLQRVPWSRLEADAAQSAWIVRNGDDVVCRLTPGHGLHGRATVAQSAAGAMALVVVREGEKVDYRELDIKGKVLVVLAPGQAVPERAIVELHRAGAAALIAVDDAACTRFPSVAGGTSPARGGANRAVRGRGVTSSRLYTTSAHLTEILHAAGREPPQAQDGPLLELGALQAELTLAIVEREAPAFNVVGVLRGSDPALDQQYVIIGSHLDHLGTAGGAIYPGADDDGSGSVGVMAVAQAFARNPIRPRRSVMFVTFCGEETGLVGSRFFTDHPPVPLEAVVAEIQMDMIGRHEEGDHESAADNVNSVHLIGSNKLSRDLHELCLARNQAHAGFDLEWDEEDVFFRSDHFNFARKGVPIAFLFTGFHPDYHQPSDTADKIDFVKLGRVARYAYDVSFELANQEARPLIDPERWASMQRELRGQLAEKPAAPLRAAH